MRLLLIGHIVTTLLSISLTSRLSQPSSSRHEYCNFTCLSPDMPDFHVACLRVFILPPWIPFQVQPPAFYTLVAEFEARGFESTPTSESGYRTRVLWESSICDVMSVDLALHSTHWAIGALMTAEQLKLSKFFSCVHNRHDIMIKFYFLFVTATVCIK